MIIIIKGFTESLELHPSLKAFSEKHWQVMPFFVFSALCCFSETFLEFILSRQGQQQGKASMHRIPFNHKKCLLFSKIMCSQKTFLGGIGLWLCAIIFRQINNRLIVVRRQKGRKALDK